MESTYNLPEPILLNCIKHHAGFIKNEIISSNYDREELQIKLLVIGDSQMDLYLGSLSPFDICNEVIDQLQNNGVLEQEKYKSWLELDGNDYQKIKLSDASVWTLRLAADIERYVHIHPGRHSPQTVRVKANTLKTAIAVSVHATQFSISEVDIDFVNQVRKEILEESPIKSLESSEGLTKILTLLSNDSD